MKFKLYSTLVAILLAFFSSNASAHDCHPQDPKCVDNFTHKMSINDFQGQSVKIKHNGWGYWVGGGAASMKTLEFTAYPNNDPQHLIGKGYCVELDQGVGYGNYDVELKKLDPNSAWQMGAAWMMKNIKVSTNFEYAAMQVAIWEVVYDGIANFDPNKSLDWFGGDNFSVSAIYSGAIKNEALSYLTLLSNVTDYGDLDGYYLATNCWKQDMIVTPVPAAVWLMGSGLLGLIGIGRRKRSEQS